jgi:cytochrome c-type biogenesis protein CcmH/NrfG
VMEDDLQRERMHLNGAEYALLGHARAQAGRAWPAVDAFERALWLLPPGDPSRPAVEQEREACYRRLGAANR